MVQPVTVFRLQTKAKVIKVLEEAMLIFQNLKCDLDLQVLKTKYNYAAFTIRLYNRKKRGGGSVIFIQM